MRQNLGPGAFKRISLSIFVTAALLFALPAHAQVEGFLISREEFIEHFKDVPTEAILKAVVAVEIRKNYGSAILLGHTADRQILMLTANHNLIYRYSPDGLGLELDGVKTYDQTDYPVDRLQLEASFDGAAPKKYLAFSFYAPSPLADSYPNSRSSQDFAFAFIPGMELERSKETPEAMLKSFGREVIKPLSFARASVDDVAFAVGFPQGKGQMISVGQVVTDALAKTVLSQSVSPYDRKVEFLISGVGLHGMSGGGVFDNQGNLMGVISRTVRGGYIRVVRIEHILKTATARARKPFKGERERKILAELKPLTGKKSCVADLDSK